MLIINKKKKILIILALFINMIAYAQEANDNENLDDEFYDFETAVGITVYGKRPKEYETDSKNAYVLNHINGSFSDRKQFMETDFLEKAGFRWNGNVKYRKTDSSEKALSVLHGVINTVTLGIIPIQNKPFFEVEYDKLPKGEVYKFESVFIKSNYKDVTPEVLIVMELEYMLQIEFRNGAIMQDNINYYTDENINKFEKLIFNLPDFPESIQQAKNRYLNELKRIKASLERYKNPSENYLRAVQNLGDSFKNIRR